MKLAARRTPNEACIEYAIAAKAVRELSALVQPSKCTNQATSEFRAGWPGPTTPIEPCLVRLFSVKRGGSSDEEEYQDHIQEIKDEMCEQCLISLKAVEDRKEARKRLAFAKRSVNAVGKRLQRERESAPC